MQRHQLQFLKRWLNNKNRKPLIIRGARQVGKSTLVELFSEEMVLSLLNVNLERFPELADVFKTKDPEKILAQIEFLPQMSSANEESILFLDEIQAVPEAIPALRYFYEDKSELPVVSAGSLLEFTLSDHQFSMPVGRVQYLHMGPMTFTEFLLATGEEKLSQLILNYQYGDSIGEIAHKRLLELLRSYYYIGGMPEAVAVYADTRSYREVSEVHNSIIETYREDFPKYAGSRNLNRILNVFNFAARNIGTKVKYSHISSQDQSATIKGDLELLAMARVISKVIHSHCSGLPLQADINEKVYKLLFLDVGLMNAISGLNWRVISQLDEMKLINEGAIAEQFIGQHLQAILSESPNRELTYWLREGRSANAEVDFVISLQGQILPIEIKAGATGSMKSLHQFMGEKQQKLAIRFDANLPDHYEINTTIRKGNKTKDVNYQLLSLPLYLVERLDEIVTVVTS
ncbi:MAG: Predicted ATPase (AAA+ superfamily) [uncultured Thiotrichaceae bacterium]|uniref:Predicted ATPase (AAA+ superfamily) n=1 Tax=uncultured Thiotrichaceae bacterium TaxID=298394 RepID=A0A6S6SRE7_9GAMM|nr:MAG: Predicted ATPase (AAA+ superfamily) [uncultured Thiotrichaceae bacterium]